MKPAPFRYHAPKTIDEAVATLAEVAPRRRPRAGRRAEPGADHGVPAGAAEPSRRHQRRRGARAARGRGRQARDRRLRAPCGVPPAGGRGTARASCSPTVVRHIAHYPIRTRGTFCGSVAHADPASEWCLVAATLDAEMVAKSVRGERAHSGARLLPGHHDDGAARRTNCWPRCGCRSCRRTRASASTSSTAAPAISRSAWRW